MRAPSYQRQGGRPRQLRGGRPRQRQGGFALVFVLWLGVLLTVLAAGAVLSARARTAASSAALAQAQAGALAEAGIRRSVLGLVDRRTRRRWTDGTTVDWRFGGGRVRLTVVPESSRIDLNSARDDVIKSLVERTLTARVEADEGELDEAVESIVDAILDWRDRDANRRPSGAEKEEYRAAGRPYIPRNGRFESTAELGQVLGVSDELVGALTPNITVFARTPRVSAVGASRDTLLSLPGATEEGVDAFLEERAAWQAQADEQLAEGEGGERRAARPRLSTTLLGDAARYVSRGAGRVFSVRAKATTANGITATRRAVVRVGGNRRGAPFELLAWSQLWEASSTPGAAPGGAATSGEAPE